MSHTRVTLRAMMTVLPIFALTSLIFAQSYPTKPIRMIVPFRPAARRIFSRAWSRRNSLKRFGHQVVIDNRPGAGGNDRVALDAGCAAGWLHVTHVEREHARDRALIYMKRPHTIPTKTSLPFRSCRPHRRCSWYRTTLPCHHPEGIYRAREGRPAKLNYGSSGVGTQFHLSGELFKLLAGNRDVACPVQRSGARLSRSFLRPESR